MTRINILPPVDLIDQHLIPETAKEIIRIPLLVNKRIKVNHPFDDIPESFTLGTGHCKFFFNKAGYITRRYIELHDECAKRGFNVNYINNLYYNIPSYLLRKYKPTPRDIQLVKSRIAQRIRESNQQPRYYGELIDKEYYIKNILKYEENI